MKYMGSKNTLLGGQLGQILLQESESAGRFVDLFAGSGAVAHFIARNTALAVMSVDLQEYARIFSASITERTVSLGDDPLLKAWSESLADPESAEGNLTLTKPEVLRRRASSEISSEGFITRHYGGHYFSDVQARDMDRLYASLPSVEPMRTVALAALLQVASVCAAAPGHTAQPFQPTESLLPYISQAWSRGIRTATRSALEAIAPYHAQHVGQAITGDAETVAGSLGEADLVFCDPPYSAVQYSRFYHVLEGIARGGWSEVSGRGRAPAQSSRKASAFSMKSKAPAAMQSLLETLWKRGCRTVITFPDANASNGLSGTDIIALANNNWHVETQYVDSVHSTLGGSNAGTGRGGRRTLKEAVILLSPKTSAVNVPIAFPIELGPAEDSQAAVAVGV